MHKARRIALNGTLFVFMCICLYPIALMFMDSFKSASELSSNPAWFAYQPTLDNYRTLFDYNGGQIVQTFCNSVFITVSYLALMLFISSLAAFAFAKYRFKGRDIIFSALLMTMMVPQELLISPLYIMMSRIGWINTYEVQIVPEAAKVLALFLLRQYMLSVPDSMLEAARIDGAGHLRVYGSVMLPIAVPALSTVAILQFISKWNEYLWPYIMINDAKKLPIIVILPTITKDGNLFSTPWELVLTACAVASLPIMVFFFFFSNKIMDSIAAGAVKG